MTIIIAAIAIIAFMLAGIFAMTDHKIYLTDKEKEELKDYYF